MKKYEKPEMFLVELSVDVMLVSDKYDPFKDDITWGGLIDDV